MQFVLIDQSNGAKTTNSESMTQIILAQIASACAVQLNRDFSAEYGGNYQVRAGNGSAIQENEIPFVLLPTLPNEPGDIAYHTINTSNGRPMLYDAITLSESLIGAGNSVACAISHELLETAADPGANLWASDGVATSYSREVCDPFENRSYPIKTGSGEVYVSDFTLQAYFIPGSKGPYSYTKKTGQNGSDSSGPMTTTSDLGYQMITVFNPTSVHSMAKQNTQTVNLLGAMRRRPIGHPNCRRIKRGWLPR